MASRSSDPSDPPSHTSTVRVIDEPTKESPPKNDLEKTEEPSDAERSDEKQSYLVSFSEGDPENPMNWSRVKRWYLTFVAGILVFNATFASAAPSNILPFMMREFGFGEEVATLTVSLFVAGYCVGPLLWGPLSEQIGRRPVFVVAFLFYTGFQVGSSLSKNTASILIFRFLGGTFAAAPLTNSGGLLGDVWEAKTRGKAMLLFVLAPFAGPALGPVVAGWIAVSGASWRWLFWVLTMFAGLCLFFIVFTMPETYAPVLLVRKAQRMRIETGDERWYAPMELNKESFARRVNKILATPFKILFQEPMLMAITLYMSFLYGCIYLLFEAYPIVFTKGHHLNAGISGLMFLPISIGSAFGVLLYLIVYNPRYDRYVGEYAPAKVPPEARLEATLVGAPLFAVSFFWFGWTSYPNVSLWSPLIAGGLMGFSIFLIFLSLINYTVDAYLFVAASALAASTVSRSIFGAAFPLFARQMFNALNPRWASTLLGFIALAMVPIPFVLQRYGPALRARSKFAPSLPPPKPPTSAV